MAPEEALPVLAAGPDLAADCPAYRAIAAPAAAVY
jgi:hypothetical protein